MEAGDLVAEVVHAEGVTLGRLGTVGVDLAFFRGEAIAIIFADLGARAIGVAGAFAFVDHALTVVAELTGGTILIGGTVLFFARGVVAPAIDTAQSLGAIAVVIAADGLRAQASHALGARRTFVVALTAIEEGRLATAGDGGGQK